MKPTHHPVSTTEDDSALDKLFNHPDGFAVEIAHRRARDLAGLLQELETDPELVFNRGACHIYASRLKNLDPRFALRVLSRPSKQDGFHVYCKMGELAIDINGPQFESDLIQKWIHKTAAKLIPCEVSVSELMKIDEDRCNPVNSRGHLLDEPFLSKAIERADSHIAQHLPVWMESINGGTVQPAS